MTQNGSDPFYQRQPQTCKTTRNMLYSYHDFQPPYSQPKYIALLLHGHGDLSYGWRTTIPTFLAHSIQCIVPDLLGFGDSSKPVEIDDYRMRLMTTDMLEILADAHIPDTAQVGSPQRAPPPPGRWQLPFSSHRDIPAC